MTNDFRSYDHKHASVNNIVRTKLIGHYSLVDARYSLPIIRNTNTLFSLIVTAVSNQIVHFYDRGLRICRITNIAEIIIPRYGAKSNSILVDVMEYDMRCTHTSIIKK